MPAAKDARRVRITVSVDPALLKWAEAQVGLGKKKGFRSVAHVVEEALAAFKESQSQS